MKFFNDSTVHDNSSQDWRSGESCLEICCFIDVLIVMILMNVWLFVPQIKNQANNNNNNSIYLNTIKNSAKADVVVIAAFWLQSLEDWRAWFLYHETNGEMFIYL